MQKGFHASGGGRGNHTEKDGGMYGTSQPTSSQEERVVCDNGKGTAPTHELDYGIPTVENKKQSRILISFLQNQLLFQPAGNEADVIVSLEYVQAISEHFANLGSSSFAIGMIELRADMKLKDTIEVAVSKLADEGISMCTICVMYEWKPPRCLTCKLFGHVLDDYPKRIILDVLNNLKNHKQVVKGVHVGPKLGFKPTKQVYQPVGKKNGANTSGNSGVVSPTHENSFEAFASPSTTSLTKMINNLKNQMLDEKLVFVDDDGKPLKRLVQIVKVK
nr:hypothetical protein [Tanacetum cinerariifolium]